jgi:hypothetical protein
MDGERTEPSVSRGYYAHKSSFNRCGGGPIAANNGVALQSSQAESKASKRSKSKEADFQKFRNNYLLVYLIIMLADWLQGTNM